MNRVNPTIILIGPLPDLERKKMGGARISFQLLVNYFRQMDWPHKVINTQSSSFMIINFSIVFINLLINDAGAKIWWINVSQKGSKYVAPLLYIMGKVMGKKVVFRPFGGSLYEEYGKSNAIMRWWVRSTLFKSDLVLLQTKELIEKLKKLVINPVWFPTVRNDQPRFIPINDYQKKYIYLGHIKEDKGIDLLFRLWKELNKEGFIIHAYGPIKEDKYKNLHPDFYQGLLPYDQVMLTLKKYNLLLLPTYFSGEGYPGSIIEAYSLGIPVISTSWKSIPELVEDGKTGKLIPIKNYDELKTAVLKMDIQKHQLLSKGARTTFEKNYSLENVYNAMYHKILAL